MGKTRLIPPAPKKQQRICGGKKECANELPHYSRGGGGGIHIQKCAGVGLEGEKGPSLPLRRQEKESQVERDRPTIGSEPSRIAEPRSFSLPPSALNNKSKARGVAGCRSCSSERIRLLRLGEEPPRTFARPQQPSCSENNLERNGGHGMCMPPPGKELGAGVEFAGGGKAGGFTPPLRAEDGGRIQPLSKYHGLLPPLCLNGPHDDDD